MRGAFLVVGVFVVTGTVSCGGGGEAAGPRAGSKGGQCDAGDCDAGLICSQNKCEQAITSCQAQSYGCSCIVSAESDAPVTGFECSADALPHTRCCADAGYPTEEFETCKCHKPENSWRCVSRAAGGTFLVPDASCSCHFYFADNESGQVSSCSEPSNVCCSKLDPDLGSPRCDCFADRTACPEGYLTTSKACETVEPEPPACDAGEVEVTSCETGSGSGVPSPSGGSSSGGASGAGGSSGSNLCTPKGGSCEDSGDCACGEGCLKTSACESCSYYCVHPCDTDKDCVEWSKGLTSPYPTCHTGSLFNYCQ